MNDQDVRRKLTAANGSLAWAAALVLSLRGQSEAADPLLTAMRDDITRMMGEVDTIREILTERG